MTERIGCNTKPYPVEVDRGYRRFKYWAIFWPGKGVSFKHRYETRQAAQAAIDRQTGGSDDE
jgi:hypothetical protein